MRLGNKHPRRDRSPFSSPHVGILSNPVAARRNSLEERRRPAAGFDQDDLPSVGGKIDIEQEDEEGDDDEDGAGHDPEDEPDEDGREEVTPLLPIFSAAHLGNTLCFVRELGSNLDSTDALPVYHLTHTIRLLVAPRCETTLSWDQLRSPQVSQFLVKPIQQQILTSHFSRATLYALMANCLQFNKEVQMNPGNSGTSKTRALVCELLAIKLLKEFSTRELVCHGGYIISRL